MPLTNRQPKVLICHPWMDLAGSELVTIWLLQALREEYDLHLCTAEGVDIDKWNAAAGTSLKHEDITWIRAPRLPGAVNSAVLPHLHRAFFERYCRSLAGGFDLLISTYNPLAFGRPAMHIIGDLRWQQQFINSADDWALLQSSGMMTTRLHKFYRGLVNRLLFRTKASDFSEKDWFVSNSLWTQHSYKDWVPQVRHELLYPPVPVTENSGVGLRNSGGPIKFVSLGRISAEKKIEDQIAILSKLRERGHDLTLTIAGYMGSSAYGETIRTMAEERPWVTLAGSCYGAEKAALLAESHFGIHTCEVEAFGIAVAELAHAGCLTMVPAISGTAEVVVEPELQFTSIDDAVEKLHVLMNKPTAELDRLRLRCRRHVETSFLPEVFVHTIRKMVSSFFHGEKIEKRARVAA